MVMSTPECTQCNGGLSYISVAIDVDTPKPTSMKKIEDTTNNDNS
jgi:hypothetical protein